MFTGIIQALGTVTALEDRAHGVRITIDPNAWQHTPNPGDSIAIDGCCLTVSHDWDHDPARLTFDAIRETLDKTAIGDRRPGDRVNIEPSLSSKSLLDGHLVQGHVEQTGTVAQIQSDPADWRMTVRVPDNLMPCVVPKGSVALDGISLTIAETSPSTLTVAIIPTTLELTNLTERRVGDRVNIETDILARTVLHQLRAFGPELLKQNA